MPCPTPTSHERAPLAFDLLLPRRVAFGWGRRRDIGALAGPLGRRALLVTGSRTLSRLGHVDEICGLLGRAGIEIVRLAESSREPRVEDVDRVAHRLHEMNVGTGDGDFVLAVGGGAAIDLGKAAAAMATNANGCSVREFLEGVGTVRTLSRPPLPVMAMPTTAGTGSEATKNAVISSDDPPFKKSLRCDDLVPRVALVDPELTASAGAAVTAHAGMDAITQLIESYLTPRATPTTRALAIDALVDTPQALRTACASGASDEASAAQQRQARETMARAAFTSGVTLANSGLGMAHGVAAALGVHCAVPHGLACAVMLPAAMRTNRSVCESMIAKLAVPLTGRCDGDVATDAARAIEAIESLCHDVGIPRCLGDIGVRSHQLDAIVASSRGNSMNGNPRTLGDEELHVILESLL
ncbi:MAG: iron-containing alcohol dehydrogenase [Planctomycetales bacterium]|nr:iron-containing alcohol dehydrogenase [Planctomycetales bacterium]